MGSMRVPVTVFNAMGRKLSTLSLVFAPDTGSLWVEFEYDSLQPLTAHCNTLDQGKASLLEKQLCTFYNKFKEEWKVLNGKDYDAP